MKITRRNFILKTLAVGAAVGGSFFRMNLSPVTADAAATGRKNTLIIYFSWSRNTKNIASEIHQKVGGDLVRLELVKPYSRDYNTVLDEAKRDQERGARPELKTQISNMDEYDVVYLGYPNWWASIPMPVATFLETYDFSGKTIAPFCSHGGGRLGQSVTDIAKLAPKAKITEGLSIHYGGGSSLLRDIDDWLQENGLVA